MNARAALEGVAAHTHSRPRHSRGILVYTVIVAVGAGFALIARNTAPRPLAIGLCLMFMTIGAWVVKPIVGLCTTLFFALVGDIVSSTWFPFNKGLSAHESVMFLNKSLIISPLEICLLAGLVALCIRFLLDGVWPFMLGAAGKAVLAFGFFVLVGLFYGAGKGGDSHIALFEFRPFFPFIAVYFLSVAVCRSRAEFRWLLWTVLAAIEVNAFLGLIRVAGLSAADLKLTETIADHGAVLRMNVLFALLIASWLIRGISTTQRVVTTVMSLPVIVVYIVAERRAAIIALVVSLGLFSIVLFWRQRRTFMKIVPAVAVIMVLYVGAFWNSQSGAGFPAQALKSVISPTQVTQRNQSSDIYRTYENYDLNFTIRSNKVLGIGLGQAFYRPAPLAELTGFAYNAYIPHNSILWVWVSFGFGGFVAMFFMLGRTMLLGAAALKTVDRAQDLTVLVTFVLSIVMFVVYASVDIAWDAPGLMLLGTAIAAATNYPRRADRRLSARPSAVRASEPSMASSVAV